MAQRVALFVHLGTPRLGGWCDACLAPSVAEADVLRLAETGVMRLGATSRCLDCGRTSTTKETRRG